MQSGMTTLSHAGIILFGYKGSERAPFLSAHQLAPLVLTVLEKICLSQCFLVTKLCFSTTMNIFMLLKFI